MNKSTRLLWFCFFQNLKKRERRAKWKVHREEALSDVGEWMEKYGDEADEVVPPLKDVHCAGCGASFHCNSSSLPGFVPVRLFQEIERNSKRPPIYQRTDYMCRRCFLYKEYQFLVSSENVKSYLSKESLLLCFSKNCFNDLVNYF